MPGIEQLFNALNGSEVKEIIIRKVRSEFDLDTRFRHSVTYPNLKFTMTLSMSYEPGQRESVIVSGNADLKAKVQAQGDIIARMEELQREQNQKVEEIEMQASALIQDLDARTRDLADANDFIKKLHADKLALERTIAAGLVAKQFDVDPQANPAFPIDALAAGGEIVMTHESEVIDEPDRLRESGETLNPDVQVIEMKVEGDAVGDPIDNMAVVGKPPGSMVVTDDSGKTYRTRDIQPARGVTLTAEKPGQGAVVPGGVKGRPRG